jgi:hypothetical protein
VRPAEELLDTVLGLELEVPAGYGRAGIPEALQIRRAGGHCRAFWHKLPGVFQFLELARQAVHSLERMAAALERIAAQLEREGATASAHAGRLASGLAERIPADFLERYTDNGEQASSNR